MCIWWESKKDQRQLEIRAAFHLWKKRSSEDPISQFEERNVIFYRFQKLKMEEKVNFTDKCLQTV